MLFPHRYHKGSPNGNRCDVSEYTYVALMSSVSEGNSKTPL